MYNFIKELLCIVMHLMFKIEVRGTINLPENEGFLLCSNHISNFDPVLIGISIDRKLSFMAKESLFKIPVLGYIIKQCGAFPVNRNGNEIATVKKAISILKDGNVMAMFPEGTRHKDGEFKEVKKGVGLIALKADTTVIPIRIIGRYKLFSKIILNIGNPIHISYMSNNENKLTVDKLTEIISDEITFLAEVK